MSNPLDDLISGALGDSTINVSLNNETVESEHSKVEATQTTSAQGDITSTVTLSYKTIRKARSNFSTNISDERYAAIIESAIGFATPKIKDMNGTEMAEFVSFHMEVARFVQGVFYEHVRNAVRDGAPVKSTRAEIEELRAKMKAERETKLAHEGRAAKSKKNQLAKAAAGDTTPLWEKLTRSNDTAQRGAGKFMKSQMAIGISEMAALKNWNDICAMSNNAAGMVLNIEGKRLDEILEAKKSKK